jgi:hypothetical protein
MQESKKITELKNLHTLEISADGFQYICALPSLTDLTIHNRVDDLKPITRLEKLKKLKCTGFPEEDYFGDLPLEPLTALTNLQSLIIQSVEPEKLKCLSSLTNLKLLEFTIPMELDRFDLGALGKLTSLTQLIIWSDTDDRVWELEWLTNLTDLQRLELCMGVLTRTGTRHIFSLLPQLKYYLTLKLDACSITEKTLQLLRKREEDDSEDGEDFDESDAKYQRVLTEVKNCTDIATQLNYLWQDFNVLLNMLRGFEEPECTLLGLLSLKRGTAHVIAQQQMKYTAISKRIQDSLVTLSGKATLLSSQLDSLVQKYKNCKEELACQADASGPHYHITETFYI